MVYTNDPMAFGPNSNVFQDPNAPPKDIMAVSNKLEKAYNTVHPGMKQLTGRETEFGSSIRPKRNTLGRSAVPECGAYSHESDAPVRTFSPGPAHYFNEVDRFGGARLGKDSQYSNLGFSQADKQDQTPGRVSAIKDPQYGHGRLGALKGLHTMRPAEADSPGPKYLLRSEPYEGRDAITSNTISTYGNRHSFDRSCARGNSQGLFSSQTIKGVAGGAGRDAQMDHPGPPQYEPKVTRGGDGILGDTTQTSFKSCGPYSAYGKPGKTKFLSQSHADVDNFGIFTPGPAYYDTTKIYSATSRTKSPDSKKIMYSLRPKLTMEMDGHIKKMASQPGPGFYDPEVTRMGKSKELDAGCKIGTAKKLERAEEEKTVPYMSPSHEQELAGKFSPGPVYNPQNKTVDSNRQVNSMKSRGFSFGASARFATGFESGHLWHRKSPAAPRQPLRKGTGMQSSGKPSSAPADVPDLPPVESAPPPAAEEAPPAAAE